MKPVFGIDITEDKYSEISYSDLFITKKLSEATMENLQQKRDGLDTTVKKAKLSIPLRAVMWLSLIWGVMVVNGILDAEVEIAQAIRNAPLLTMSGFAALIVWGVLFTVGKIKEKVVLKEENADEKSEEMDMVTERAFAELGVPSGAIRVDILAFKFAIKDGAVKPKTGALEVTPYFNFEMRAYLCDYNLCLADVESVWRFPLESLKAIKTVKKNVILPTWNKETPYNKGEYKPYKMSSNNYGVYVKPYHILELEKDGETYGIYFPAYELASIEGLTLLKAEEPEK